MPRDANGEFLLVAGNPVETGTVIDSDWANSTLPDIGGALTESLSRSGDGGMLVALRGVQGSVNSPAIAATSFPTTGMYWAAADDLRVSVGAIDRFRWRAADDLPQIWDNAESEWIDISTATSFEDFLLLTGGTLTGLLTINQSADNHSLKLTSEATTFSVVNIFDAKQTTGTVFEISSADALTTGRLANFHSDSPSTEARKLVEITNANPLGTATCLHINNAGVFPAINIQNSAGTGNVINISTAGTTTGTVLALTTIGSLTSGSIADFHSTSPDGGVRKLVRIRNDSATADNAILLDLVQAGGDHCISIQDPASDIDEVIDVFNANSLSTAGIMRLHSNSPDASTRILLNIANDNPSAAGATCLNLQQDANEDALRIRSGAAGGNALHILEAACTTGQIVNVTDDASLITGGLATFESNSIRQESRVLFNISNHSTAAGATLVLRLQQKSRGVALQIADAGTTDAPVVQVINANALTTGNLMLLESNSPSTDNRTLFFVRNINPLATDARTARFLQSANAQALLIDSSGATTADVVSLIDHDSLTSGSILVVKSNAADTSTVRTLVDFANLRGPASNVTVLTVTNAAQGLAASFHGLIRMTNMPTSNPGVGGYLWNNNGVVNITAEV